MFTWSKIYLYSLNNIKAIDANSTFVAHSMICCKYICSLIILEVALHKIVNFFRYLVDHLNII